MPPARHLVGDVHPRGVKDAVGVDHLDAPDTLGHKEAVVAGSGDHERRLRQIRRHHLDRQALQWVVGRVTIRSPAALVVAVDAVVASVAAVDPSSTTDAPVVSTSSGESSVVALAVAVVASVESASSVSKNVNRAVPATRTTTMETSSVRTPRSGSS